MKNIKQFDEFELNEAAQEIGRGTSAQVEHGELCITQNDGQSQSSVRLNHEELVKLMKIIGDDQELRHVFNKAFSPPNE